MRVERGCRLHQKVALTMVELWMSVTHAGDVVGIILVAFLSFCFQIGKSF